MKSKTWLGGGDTEVSFGVGPGNSPYVAAIGGRLAANANNKRFRLLGQDSLGTFVTIFDTGANLNGVSNQRFSLLLEYKGDQWLRIDFRIQSGAYIATPVLFGHIPTGFKLNGDAANDIRVDTINAWRLYDFDQDVANRVIELFA